MAASTDLARDAEREGTLISCSFAPPSSTGDIVSRPRLLDLLTDALRRPLTIVSGEPASGKTTLVVDWLRSEGARQRAVAWLTLPHRLDDDLLFWRYLLAALGPLSVRTDDLENQLADGEPPDDRWLNVLANRLAGVPNESVVVIDDLHELDNPPAIEALRALLERVPPNAHVLLMSRSKPPWPVAEWRMNGRIEELHSIDLRFTLDELKALVASVPGLELSDEGVSLLLDRTEGWAGGIKLALLSLRHSDDAGAFVRQFAADDELVSSYLFRGVLERQKPEIRDFLLDISVLEFITPEICDAIRERDDGHELLLRCRSENLFLVDLPGPERYFRMHGLFAQLLQATLQSSDPGRWVELHRRASVVFERRGDVHSMVAHAVAARDDGRVGALIARYAGGHAHRGEWDEISSWLALLRTNVQPGRPETTMALAITLSLTGAGDEAVELLDGIAGEDLPDRMRYAALQLRGFVLTAKGAVDEIGKVGDQLRQPVPDGDFVLPFDEVRFADYLTGLGAYMNGDLVAARDACGRAAERRERPSLFYVESPGWLARVAYEEGMLSESVRLAHESLTRHVEIRSGETAVAVPAQLALADVAWERDDLEECERRLVLAGRTVRPLFWERVLIEASAARLRASRGDLPGAAEGLADVGNSYLSGSSSPQLRGLVSRCAVDLALRAGNVNDALNWANAFDSCRQGPLPAALRIRMAVATDAANLASKVADALSATEPTPSKIDTLLAAAEVALLDGDAGRADVLIGRATLLAEPEGFVRRFCDAPPGIRKAVVGLSDGQSQESGSGDRASPFFLGVLASTLRQAVRASAGQGELVDPLTDRELEVLDLLVVGRSYSEIGSALFVSRNTVKSHVRHVYTKLGVASRSEAASEAQRLGLV